MTFTYQPGGGDRDWCRLIIGDVAAAAPIFQDEEIDMMLRYEVDPRYAAARALDTMANSQIMILKSITVFDLHVDGPAVAKALREGAVALRKVADNEPAFDWAEQVTSPGMFYERIWMQWLRGRI